MRRLVVQDEEGRDRIVLGSDVDGVRLSMLDVEGKRRAFLHVDNHRASRLVLLDREEEWRYAVQLIHGDAPYISLYGGPDRQKYMRIQAPIEGAVGFRMSGGPGEQNEQSSTTSISRTSPRPHTGTTPSWSGSS